MARLWLMLLAPASTSELTLISVYEANFWSRRATDCGPCPIMREDRAAWITSAQGQLPPP
jgi:hypothetical protein